MSWSFRNLSLKNVDAQRGSTTLSPGRYAARISDVELKQTQGGGQQVAITWVDTGGQGSIRDFITVHHPRASTDTKVAQAVEIGQSRLKAVLEFGGHPSPDEPGDINSLKGLVCGIHVEEGEAFHSKRADGTLEYNQDGTPKMIKAAGKMKKSGAYFPAAELGYTGARNVSTGSGPAAGGAAQSGGQPDLDDEIPF